MSVIFPLIFTSYFLETSEPGWVDMKWEFPSFFQVLKANLDNCV